MNREILVIDDNPDIRQLICNILRERNFEVRAAANYDQAVFEINKKLPDLAIIDLLHKPLLQSASTVSLSYSSQPICFKYIIIFSFFLI